MELKLKNLMKLITFMLLGLILSPVNTLGQADFEQSDDENGFVVIETEDFSDERTASDGSSWEVVTDPADFSGTGAVQATHADGGDFTDHKVFEHAQDNAPVLKYTVNFVKVAPVYVWARTSHVDGYDDSVWPGLDGSIAGTADQSLTYLTSEQENTGWYYINHGMDENRFTIDIPEIGEHIFELYFRETNLIIDQIILTINADYDPNVSGAPDSPTAIDAPSIIEISGAYPNPVDGSATIQYTLKEGGLVNIAIVNLDGREIETLVSKHQTPGVYKIEWQTKAVAPGIYFYRIQAGEYTITEKLIVK